MGARLFADMGKSRIAAIELATLTLRCMENWSWRAGGYDEAMILVAVIAIASEKFLRGGLPAGFENLHDRMPGENLALCNIASIAAATGLNRETARRKVTDLVERGMLTRVDREGVRFSDGLMQEDGTIELVTSQVEAFRRTAERLLRGGVLTFRET